MVCFSAVAQGGGAGGASHLPIVNHLAPEVHVHLIGAVPNGLTVEYMPWSVAMFEEVPWPKNGILSMPAGRDSPCVSTARPWTVSAYRRGENSVGERKRFSVCSSSPDSPIRRR